MTIDFASLASSYMNMRTFVRGLLVTAGGFVLANPEAIAAVPGAPWWVGPLLLGAGVMIRSARAQQEAKPAQLSVAK